MTDESDRRRVLAHDADRKRLLREIEAEAKTIAGWFGRSSIDPRVLDALDSVPREEFVPPGAEGSAYANVPLPIGQGQTISQPFIVALMTDLLKPNSDDVVLEVGTGSGYQAAVLARLVRCVYTMEVIAELAGQAQERLARLGYRNVEVRHGDGYHGWTERAPFDGIVVTAAARDIPPPLVQQLKDGGRMVIPVGAAWRGQELMLVEKDGPGQTRARAIVPVAFVPLTR
ncbi:MAG: protein-L-isoaspartate O-methyltransferase [Acidobacteria bacterium RBG_16_68_9]|nr:MAG: protein-L-isoaspartate O-methyltransferase [Acidobacteria bacterium RBG_16_68_9]